MGNENSVERVPDENSETAKSNTENLTPPKKSHKKKIPDNDGGNSLNVLFDKTKNDGPSSKAKKIKKATHENDADVNPSVLEDVKNLPAPPKKSHKKKIPANSDGNSLNFLFDKTKNGAFSDAKKSKKVKASQLPISDNNSPPKSSSKNKNGVTPNSAKKSTQQSIFGFCTHQSPAVSSGNDKVKAKECFDDALKALKKGQHFAFKQAINAAQKLSESSIESIESECFKFAVLKYRRNNIDYDENENYQIYERMLSQFSKNICEDTSILNSKAFPDLKPAIENTQHLNLFGSCLAISQFFASFPIYLETTLKFSAEDLLKAVTSGVEGYHKLTAEILAEFIHTFSTYDWFKGYKFFTSHLRDITWNGTSASEICKLFLLKDISPLTREIKHSLDGKLFDIIKGNKSELEKKLAERNIVIPPFDKCLAEAFIDKEFHELLPKQQILILEYLVDLFMADYFFIRQFEPEECKVIEREKIDAMKKELQELIIKNQTMKRSEKKRENEEKKPDQQYVRKKRNLELQILYAERRYTLNKLNAALKPLPITLGYDRFHRRYYIFQNSPNSGIYIEEFCQISLDDETEFENDSIASELEKFTVESTRIPMKTSQWYRVSTKEELNEIKEILCKKGIRENLLSETIEHNEAAISETLNAEIKPRDLKFNENESELEFLKISMKKVFDKAEKYSLIHFSQTYEDLIAKISGANTFEELRTVIVSCVPSILPCAFEPYAPGVKFFRITSWIQFAGLCQSYSQMHALLLVLFEKIRTDKLFGAIVCPRCDIRFDRIERRGVNSKATIISCNLCYGYIHFKCHFENTEIDPSPTEPSWICEPCKKLDNHNEEDKKNVEEEEDIIDSKPKTVIVGDKVLRATKARERKDTESETASSQTSSRNTVSRNSEWENETTRSLRPRRQGTNYAETSFVEEKSLKSKSKILVLPPQIKVKVKEEIRERYDDFCSDSRILGSLRPVKFEACENSEMTIDLLKSNLHKFKKINQLDAVFQSLREAAILHFKNNVRKFDEIQRHFKEFFGEDDATTDEEEDYQEEENDDNNVEDSDVEEEDDKNNGEDSDVEEAEEKDDE